MTDVVTRVSSATDNLAGWLYRRVPKPRVVASTGLPSRPRRVLVFTKGENASFDYYLAARLKAFGLPYETCCIDTGRFADIDPEGLLVIICRYLRRPHASWIARNRRSLAGVAYFVDDDIPALAADKQSGLGYRFYLAYFAGLPMIRLNRGLLTHLWVSTAALARTMAPGEAEILAPAPIIEDHLPRDRPGTQSPLKIVYHATGSHHREHAFLIPVMKEVLRQRPAARFEVLAKGSAARLWRDAAIPDGRMRILPPMGWPRYYRHSREEGADIALMPLMEGLANDSRADTKLIDCCRMGAAAVLSDTIPYRHHRNSGCVMVGNSHGQWIETLLALIDNVDRRDAAIEATRKRVLSMTVSKEPFPRICGPKDNRAAA